jgi:divinyl chlorophyllide a 8-vinyl-reductase
LLRWASRLIGLFGPLVPALADKAELARIGHYYATESMLVWDDEAGVYDAEATPETGEETLRAFYQRVAREGLAEQELGEHRMFERTGRAKKNRGA